jgi:hypothetical protein
MPRYELTTFTSIAAASPSPDGDAILPITTRAYKDGAR